MRNPCLSMVLGYGLLSAAACGPAPTGSVPTCGANQHLESTGNGPECRDNTPAETPKIRFCDDAETFFGRSKTLTTAESGIVQANLQDDSPSGPSSPSSTQTIMKVGFVTGAKDVTIYPYAEVFTAGVRYAAAAKFYLGDKSGPSLELPGASWDPAPLDASVSGADCSRNIYVLYPKDSRPENISFTVSKFSLIYFYVVMNSASFTTNQKIKPRLWFQYSVDGSPPQECGPGPDTACALVGHSLLY